MRLVASVLGLVLTVSLASGCSSSASPVAVPPPRGERTSMTCPDPINVSLPTWAGMGFAHPKDPIPHLVGTRGTIIAVPFGWPLRDHQPTGHNNKILWIARSGTGPLRIVATDQSTGESVTKVLPAAPGPSVVNMPKAGCWRFTLNWSDQHDELLIRYFGPPT